MAFEAFRAQGRTGSTLRRVVFVLVVALHGLVIMGGVAYSYWHVDELTPPTLRVTFMSASPQPPPPPPPPPGGSGAKPKKVAIKTKAPDPVVTKPTEIVQPREKPVVVKKEFRKHEDEEEEEDEPQGVRGGKPGGIAGGVEGGTVGGTAGGKIGGVIGGTPGGTGAATVAPKFLPPNLGALQRENCADAPFPASHRRPGSFYVVMAKVCVSRAGSVESVNIMKHADSVLDEGVVSSEKACHYKPLIAGGTTVPFCYIGRYEFKGQ